MRHGLGGVIDWKGFGVQRGEVGSMVLRGREG